ncbi:MAG: response regulator transcription factor [Anaerolineales bacterium]
MKARILWVEGNRTDNTSFVPSLRKKDYWVEIVPTGHAAMTRLVEIDPDLVVVNAASLRSSGKRICNEIREKSSELPIVLIVSPEHAISGVAKADVVLELPFTSRKLLNRIAPLLPGDGKNVLHVGLIRLDLERKRVRCLGREARLTPRLTHLLQVLLLHAGEAVDRQRLFSEVWDTQYTADTRTLDVHISWLREALEEDPRQPQFLKTIRGVGYRLDA